LQVVNAIKLTQMFMMIEAISSSHLQL